jgi:hypothetical protein
VKRAGGVTVVAILTLFGAAILSLSSFVFFFVAVMAMSGGGGEEPVSVALAGMGAAGGLSLLILAVVAVCLAIGVLKLREWARSMSIALIAAGFACTLLSLFALRGYLVIPVLPSVVWHLFVLATAGCTVEYLSRARVKQLFNMATLNFHASLRNDATRRFRSTPIVVISVVPRNAIGVPGYPGIIRAFLGIEWVKNFDTSASKSASEQEFQRAALVETDRERLTDLVDAADATIVHRRREFTLIEDGVHERAATVGVAQQPIRIKADIQGWPSPKSGSRRNPQPEVIEKVRRVESIHHWHRQV